MQVVKMDFRAAVSEDFPELKSMYEEIMKRMKENGISIWDDIYPCGYFEDDIRKGRLYLMLDENRIISAFALCGSHEGESYVEWENSKSKACYLDRFGVNAAYSRKGIGSLTLEKAKETAKKLGAEYLRLFVVDINTPAICLYRKNGFTRGKGVYEEVIEEGFSLREYGYEIKL